VCGVARRSTPRPGPAQGIALRHQRHCAARSGGACGCRPAYQAQAWSARDRKPIRRTFATLAEARAWRQDTQVALRRGTTRAPLRITVRESAEAWLRAARAGVVRTRSGERYKPSALRSYEQALRATLLPELGHLRLTALTRTELQDLVDRLVAKELAPSTVRNTILPLRALYRHAASRLELAHNPTVGLALPAVRARRERIARPAEARALLVVLAPADRALWATALYAGLRRGELQALRWADLELDARVVEVRRSWDRVEGPIEPKSRSGRRRIPLSETLRAYLLAHRLGQGRGGRGLAFGASEERAFEPSALLGRARSSWNAAGLAPIALHECRHTYAAFMIAAGVNPKALQQYMGHSSITVTLDRYGHLMPGAEKEAAGMLDAYLSEAPA
jgi:integrase